MLVPPATKKGSRASAPEPPWPVPPMLAKAGPRPAGSAGWSFEFKWDGYRTLLLAEQGKVRLHSRNLHDVTAEYPELQEVSKVLGDRAALLDGELVVLDDQGRPSFERLQGRAGFHGRPSEPHPVTYLAFDLLWLDGDDLRRRPLAERRAALEGLGLKGEHCWVPPTSPDGEVLEAAAQALGLEGILAKRLDSLYDPGKRTPAWVKVKLLKRQEFVIGGWTPGEGNRRGSLGALVVGVHTDKGLHCAGSVGTGFTDKTLRDLQERLAPLRSAASPFAKGLVPKATVFVEPRLVCEVAFTEWTRDGQLRHPSYKGLRTDKEPEDVVREEVP